VGEKIRNMTDALGKEREAAYISTEKAKEYERQIKQCRDSMTISQKFMTNIYHVLGIDLILFLLS
jgi:hypothetical protein